MKQRLFCLALAAALLTGCGAAPAGTTPDTAQATSGQGEEAAVTETAASTGLHVLDSGDAQGFYSAGSSLDAGLSRLNYVDSVSYTHRDVYKRQCVHRSDRPHRPGPGQGCRMSRLCPRFCPPGSRGGAAGQRPALPPVLRHGAAV